MNLPVVRLRPSGCLHCIILKVDSFRGNAPPSSVSDSKFSAEISHFAIFHKTCEPSVDVLWLWNLHTL